jgi:hypothetical protein
MGMGFVEDIRCWIGYILHTGGYLDTLRGVEKSGRLRSTYVAFLI